MSISVEFYMDINNSNKISFAAITYFLLMLLALFTFFPLLTTGFTTNDDTVFSTLGNGSGALYFAKLQGRIGFLLHIPLVRSAYVLDNAIYYNLLRFGSPLVLLTVISFFFI